ncbi:hypothetical protein FXN65_15465 [Metapseudomonas lalkuanensis]|uniref:Uncharacterized protein n=1 Tax=Metapseudomonas lalkuanensis TaxID=2604832 RepID=A0A5J6QLR9_9GAMM|nr:hypothetical protein [Pseudomonas lalkuanensis]QEY63383.1 hypothetical protein FXN65_15465 [Pseudomonas lalkuanensis]
MYNLSDATIESLISKLTTIHNSSETDEKTKFLSSQILEAIKTEHNHPVMKVSEDFISKESIKDHQGKILEILQSDLQSESVANLHLILARTYREAALRGGHIFNNFKIVTYYLKHEDSDTEQEKVDEIRFEIANKIISEDNIEAIKTINDHNKNIESWSDRLAEWGKKAAELEKSLRISASNANFLILSESFSEMLKAKTTEKYYSFISMILLGALAISIPIWQLLHPNESIASAAVTNGFDISLATKISMTIILEALTLYFFRIALHQWNSIKSQIIQLELRKSLCQFIINYSEFAQSANKDSLGKFENLIFSEITRDPTNTPNVFDAAESISKVISNLKSQPSK